MDGFHYIDIFATKGIEYMVVIAFLLLLIPFWIVLNKPTRKAFQNGKQSLNAMRCWFSFREGRYYHQGHSWAMPVGNGVVRVGVDDFCQKLVGSPASILLPRVGEKVSQGDVGWKIEVDSKKIDVLSPVNGRVLRVNEKALESPDIINQDPYDNGWLLEIEVPKIKADMRNLLGGKLSKDWMAEVMSTLREKMSGELGVVMQDGGLPVDGFAKSLSPDRWDEMVAEFLQTK